MADVAELRALQQAVERVGPAAETELANDILEHGLSRHPAAAAAESQASLLRRVDAVRRVMQKQDSTGAEARWTVPTWVTQCRGRAATG